MGEWKTQDGKLMMVKDMDDRHLINSIRMLERNAEAYKQRELSAGYSLWGTLQGEQALDTIEHDISILEDMPALDFLEEYMPIYKKMKLIARERGLLESEHLAERKLAQKPPTKAKEETK